MSSDRLTEILNFLSAISRDIGAFRAETNARLDRLEAEVRAITTRFDRLESRVLEIRADGRDLEDRVVALEGRQN